MDDCLLHLYFGLLIVVIILGLSGGVDVKIWFVSGVCIRVVY